MQVTEARAALKAADAALTAAKAECEAADERRRELAAELTLAQGALQGGSPGCSVESYQQALMQTASSCVRPCHRLVFCWQVSRDDRSTGLPLEASGLLPAGGCWQNPATSLHRIL